jgi:cytochrome c-type biogenesis protein CcmE
MKINRFWLCGILVGAGFTAGLVATIRASAADYVTVSELKASPERWRRVEVKVTGKVVAATTRTSLDPAGQTVLVFQVEDAKGARAWVHHRGPKPDAYRDGGEVILEGSYDGARDEIRARTLLAKCPSRYEERAGKPAAEYAEKKPGAGRPTAP